MRLQFKRLHDNAYAPEKNSIGYEILADDEYIVNPFSRQVVTTGLTIKIPDGFRGRILPRTGLAIKHGLDVFAGVLEPDYSGELKVLLFNSDRRPFIIHPGYKIAVLVLEPNHVPDVSEIEEIDLTCEETKYYKVTGV